MPCFRNLYHVLGLVVYSVIFPPRLLLASFACSETVIENGRLLSFESLGIGQAVCNHGFALRDPRSGVVKCTENGWTTLLLPKCEPVAQIIAEMLIQAARNGELDKVTSMLELGANIEAKENDGRTALISAAQNGHTEVVEFLLKRGANVEAKDNAGRTALFYTNQKLYNFSTIADLLSNQTNIPPSIQTNPKKSRKEGVIPGSNIMPLCRNVWQIAQSVLKLTVKDQDAFHAAGSAFLCQFQQSPGVQKYGVMTNNHVIGENVLRRISPPYRLKMDFLATFVENSSLVLTIGVDTANYFTYNELDATFLELRPHVRDKLVRMQLQFLELEETVEVVVNRPIYVFQYPAGYEGPQIAIGSITKVRENVFGDFEHQASTEPGSSGSPLINQKCKVVGLHKEFDGYVGCNVAASIKTVLQSIRELQNHLDLAVEQNNSTVLREIVTSRPAVDVNWRNRRTMQCHKHWKLVNGTPLHRAVCSNADTIETVRLLLNSNAEIEAKDNDGWTPLLGAVSNHKTATVALLLDRRANVNATNNAGETALMWAALNGCNATVRMLLDQGADVDQRDNSGKTALFYANQQGHLTISKLLSASSAKAVAMRSFERNYFERFSARPRDLFTIAPSDIEAILVIGNKHEIAIQSPPSLLLVCEKGEILGLSNRDWSTVDLRCQVKPRQNKSANFVHAVFDYVTEQVYLVNHQDATIYQISYSTVLMKNGGQVQLEILADENQVDGRWFDSLSIDCEHRLLYASDYFGSKHNDISIWRLLPSGNSAQLIASIRPGYKPSFSSFFFDNGHQTSSPQNRPSLLYLAVADVNNGRIDLLVSTDWHQLGNNNNKVIVHEIGNSSSVFKRVTFKNDETKFGPVSAPFELAFDSVGNLFLCNAGYRNERIQVFTFVDDRTLVADAALRHMGARTMNAIWASNRIGPDCLRLAISETGQQQTNQAPCLITHGSSGSKSIAVFEQQAIDRF